MTSNMVQAHLSQFLTKFPQGTVADFAQYLQAIHSIQQL